MKESKVVMGSFSSTDPSCRGSAGKKQAPAGRRSCRFASADVLDAAPWARQKQRPARWSSDAEERHRRRPPHRILGRGHLARL